MGYEISENKIYLHANIICWECKYFHVKILLKEPSEERTSQQTAPTKNQELSKVVFIE